VLTFVVNREEKVRIGGGSLMKTWHFILCRAQRTFSVALGLFCLIGGASFLFAAGENSEALKNASLATIKAYVSLADMARDDSDFNSEMSYLEKAAFVQSPAGVEDAVLNYELTSALNRLLDIYIAKNRLDDSAKLIKSWLEKNSGRKGILDQQTAVLERLANLYRKQGKKKEAVEVFQDIIRLNSQEMSPASSTRPSETSEIRLK
jgi:tetratricopeptide (TPR) repeat protein